MDKKLKKFLAIIPGAPTAVDCRFCDISYGIRQLRESMKVSDKMSILSENKQYTKKSILKRDILAKAKYTESRKKNDRKK